MEFAVRSRHVLVGSGRERCWLEDAYVVVRDGRIDRIGTGSPSGLEVVDLGESVLFPGFVDLDALVDIDHLLLDSWHSPEDAQLLAGSVEHWAARRTAVLSAAERNVLRTFGLAQLAVHGITSYMPIATELHLEWGESAQEMRAMAEVSRTLGLRGWLGPSYRSAVVAADIAEDGTRSRRLVADEELGRAGFAEAVAFADELIAADDPLLRPVLLPCRIETMSEELLGQTARAASERDLPVRLHSLQQGWERAMIQERYGVTPLDLIDRTGLLNERLLIPHAMWTDRNPQLGGLETPAEESADLRRLAAAGASVIHCPLTSFRYGGVLHTLTDYNRAGITMALGTDSFPPDLIRGMDVGVHVARERYGHGSADLAQYVDAATTGGATALRRRDLGRIEPGAGADFTAFALDDFRDGVVDDPLRTLVLAGTARNATFSMVAGRTVMRDGELPGVDLTGLRRQAQDVFAKLRQGYALRDPLHRTAAEIFPPTFPVAQAASAAVDTREHSC